MGFFRSEPRVSSLRIVQRVGRDDDGSVAQRGVPGRRKCGT